MIVSPMLHNPDITCAANDALFVDPSRRGYVGGRLMLEAEREAARRGATRIIWRTRAGTGLASALQKRGYLLADIGLTKEITDGNH
jgi:GNAT superfamily N-acetyltransferase